LLNGNAWRAGVLLLLTCRASANAPGNNPMLPNSSVLAIPSASAEGQTPDYEGKTVAGIDLPGVPEVDRERLIQMLPQKAGEPYSRRSVQASIRALYGTGRFADIQAEAVPSGDGVRLSFRTAPNFFVGKVDVEASSLAHPSRNQIVNSAKFELGELYTLENLDRALESARRLMEENGYYHARVTAESTSNPTTQEVDILIHITAGEPAKVGTVQVLGPGNKPEENVSGLQTGQQMTVSRLSRALQRIRKRYEKQHRALAQVAVAEQKYRPEANSVDFTFSVDPGPVVSIYTQGFKVSRSVLKKQIPVFEEHSLDDDLLNEGKRNLLDYLQAKGHFDAAVDFKKESSPDSMSVVYSINPGPIHKVESVTLVGNKYFDRAALEPLLEVQPATRFVSHGRYSGVLVRADVARLQSMYRTNGFLQAHIESKVDDNSHGGSNRLAVRYEIEEGTQTRVGRVEVTGNARVSLAELPPLETVTGQPYSEQNLSTDRQRVLNFYFNRGYSNATLEVAPQASVEQPGREDVTFRIEEGEQFVVNQVIVSGLEHTRPYIVDRELQVAQGQPLSEEALLETQTRLYNLAIFNQVDVAVQNPNGGDPRKNVLVQAEEAKRYTFTYGLGFEFQTSQPAGSAAPQGETGVSPRVSFDITRLNVGGRNRTLSFQSDVGRLQQRGLVSYQLPRLFDVEKLKLVFTALYDNSLDVSTFTSQKLEGKIQLNQDIGKINPIYNRTTTSMAYRFEFRRVKASNFAEGFSTSLVPLFSLPARVGGPGATYTRDKRDNPLESTRGNYTTIDGFVSSGKFGSEADFARLLTQNSTYQAFGGKGRQGHQFVFARSTSIGLEQPFAGTHVVPPGACPTSATGQPTCTGLTVIPLPELFFAGGGNSHRGFGLNQAGPRDPSSGFPLGGTALFVNNLELRFPPVTLPYLGEGFGIAIFHDMGNVFTTGHDELKGLMRWHQDNPARCLNPNGTPVETCFSRFNSQGYDYTSHAAGVGLRYRTPIGPLRFDFGYNLNPTSYLQAILDPRTGQPLNYYVPKSLRHFNVFFSIGQPF
jgi:outer membrane protein insertion porin family